VSFKIQVSDLHLRRKLTFHTHGRTLVLVKRSNEKIERWCFARVHPRPLPYSNAEHVSIQQFLSPPMYAQLATNWLHCLALAIRR
jgi:hypothetical protein